MSLRKIGAIILMHSAEFTDKSELFEIFYFWLFDILFLGFFSKSFSTLTGSSLLGTLIIVSVITMRPCERAGIVMARLIADDLSARIFLSTHATPITHVQWTIGGMIVGILQALLRICLGCVLIFLIFDIHVLQFSLIPFFLIPFFLLSGVTTGLIVSSLVYVLGKQCIMFLRAISFTFMALCGVYAPVSALPPLLQHISWWLPATYLLTGLREHLLNGVALMPFLLKNLALNAVYALVGILLLYVAIKHAKKHGFAHLENK